VIAESGKAPEAPRRRRQHHAREIDHERHIEHQPPAEAVGEPAEHQSAEHRARDIRGPRAPDLCGGKPQRLRILQHRPDRADNGNFKTVENPGHPERDDHENVEAAPRKPVETSRDIGGDRPLLPH
jgi:hypothetical protein